jgi:gamma-glutamyl:cysteine ligase YbdK (ATP-grasp superfamily)
LLERPGFGVGPATVGAELELFLVDGAGRALPCNQAVRSAVADSRVSVELNRFNLELNASPVPLAGRPFAALGGELHVLLDHIAAAARQYAGRPALIGILPTLTREELGPDMMTDAPRYRALNAGLRYLRPDPFRVRITGDDPLELDSEDVGLEGTNSSFQVHLRVDPADFTRTYNAVQLATAPVLRALPAGPTVIDMLANAAFLAGLSMWLAGQDEQWTYALPFERADHNFYRAAQHGLSAQLTWPAGWDRTRTAAAARLAAELVPAARQGLIDASVAVEEADGLLQVISARIATGQTGAVWQRATLAAVGQHHDRERALAIMFGRYLRHAETGMPVHTWPAAS